MAEPLEAMIMPDPGASVPPRTARDILEWVAEFLKEHWDDSFARCTITIEGAVITCQTEEKMVVTKL